MPKKNEPYKGPAGARRGGSEPDRRGPPAEAPKTKAKATKQPGVDMDGIDLPFCSECGEQVPVVEGCPDHPEAALGWTGYAALTAAEVLGLPLQDEDGEA